MKKFFITFIFSIVIFIVIISIWSTITYNNLVKLNENIRTQWSQVETVYQRRLDLIPNLVNIVKGSGEFEKETLLKIVESRSRAISSNINTKDLNQYQINKYQQEQEQINKSINKLLIIIEQYPNLKSTRNFYELQNQLEGTENRINVERNQFNEEVNQFNSYRNSFPKNFVANLFYQFKEKGYFKSQMGSETTPIINFYN
ncbi:LemA family protein [Blattabacterium cuenoti]|uniref:LemA family protein n=1 Tax=Blattabacterium cuenoti TaxID=1653831 RepID=UPI00163C83CD|nr:LemA family protein [Blattabacterium cuenoti]